MMIDRSGFGRKFTCLLSKNCQKIYINFSSTVKFSGLVQAWSNTLEMLTEVKEFVGLNSMKTHSWSQHQSITDKKESSTYTYIPKQLNKYKTKNEYNVLL